MLSDSASNPTTELGSFEVVFKNLELHHADILPTEVRIF